MGKGGSGLSRRQSVLAQRERMVWFGGGRGESGDVYSVKEDEIAWGPLLPLLNSFNKHLTFTGRKINTQEVTLLCSRELLLEHV